MKTLWIAPLLAGTALAAGAQALNVKPGGWDMTIKINANGQSHQMATKTCLTKEDIDASKAFTKDEDGDCTHTLTTRTATRWSGTTVCKGDNPGKGTLDLVVHDPESVTMKMTRQSKASSGTVEMTGKWASASCKGYDD